MNTPCCPEKQLNQETLSETATSEEEFYANKEKNSSDRLAICKICTHLKSINRCELCGCFVNIKTRIFWASCPIGKW